MKRQILHVAIPLELGSTVIPITETEISWDIVKSKPPINSYRDVEINYFAPICRMCKKLNINCDNFPVALFRSSDTKKRIRTYLQQFTYQTAKNSITRIIDVIRACGHAVTTVDLNDYIHMKHDIRQNKNTFHVITRPPIKQWNDILPILKRLHHGCITKVPSIRMLACLFEKGYVLRPGILTKIVINDLSGPLPEETPTLDINTGRVYIPIWKSHGADFIIDITTLNYIRTLLLPQQKFLLVNTKNKPIRRNDLKSYFFNDIAPSCCRKSYITWFITTTGRTPFEVEELSKILGNSILVMWHRYLKGKKLHLYDEDDEDEDDS